ncbi:ABC transporter permease [Sulfoacidibacillus thermotolerans]|uniref:ABC-2 type transporter transmembrane domain-containing protein n=1 Tax=Sulfoacidibacillus thermotolerans TaxID=1765684 RepID=A0A2U3D628_SULT2|nr:ABC transporter permease [Sulfoacidibacillus thermotolerans]PWI56733.1 hypothetical protein BM613_12220 [Sulfoacidibacillus thermotolerans]
MLNALTAEWRREWIQLRRYPTEMLSELVVIVLVFYGLFLGASYMAGGAIFSGRLSDIIVGYVLWTLSMMSVGTMGWTISNEAQNGTLEQVFLSPFGAWFILLLRNMASVVISLLFTVITLFSVMAITHHYLVVSLWDVVPALLMIASAMGLGYLVASVTILMKRSQQLLNLLQFILLFLIMSPTASLSGPWRWVGIIAPFAPVVALLRNMMTKGESILSAGDWLIWSVVNAVLWLLVGLTVFAWAQKKAKRRGNLSHY